MRIRAGNSILNAYLSLIFFNSLIFFVNEFFLVDLSWLFLICVLAFNTFVIIRFKAANFRQKIIFLAMLIFYLLLLFRGYLRGNYLNYFYVDTAYFSSFSLILYANSYINIRHQVSSFISSFSRILYVTLPLAIFIFVSRGFAPPKDLDSRFLDNDSAGLYTAVNVVFFSLYFIVFLNMLREVWTKLFLITSVIFIFLYSIITLSRGLLIASSFSLMCALFVNKGTSLSVVFLMKYLGLLVLSLFLFYISFSVIYGHDNFDIVLSLLKYRFFDDPDFSGGRNEEERLLIADFSTFETIFGRGLGAANNTWIWSELPNGMNIVHKWYLHLFLKGGYFYIVLFIGVSVFGLLNALAQKNYFLIPFFVVFFLLSSGHTQFYNFVSMSLFWIFLGFGLASERRGDKTMLF